MSKEEISSLLIFFIFHVMENIEEKINELYNLIMDKPLRVLEIFNDFFGESMVDIQGFMTTEDFRKWLGVKNTIDYIPQDILEMEECAKYYNKALWEIKEEDLDNFFIILQSSRVVRSIGNLKFNHGFILVHFPHVRITNENDRFVDINHLYAKININSNGLCDGYFGLNRSEYSYLHMMNGYLHSHISSIPTSDFTRFQSPCLGDGPIRHTLTSLTMDFDEDMWRLFCLELDKYVHTESLAGGPYHRLENIGTNTRDDINGEFKLVNTLRWYQHFNTNMAVSFTEYLIKSNRLKFNYRNGNYSIGMSFIEFIVLISNEFIEWYNQEFNKGTYRYFLYCLVRDKVIYKVIISNGRIYYNSNERRTLNTYRSYVGKHICFFKGKNVTVNITDINDISYNNESIILNPNIALYILSMILKVVNYEYGKPEQRDEEDNRVSEKVRYF